MIDSGTIVVPVDTTGERIVGIVTTADTNTAAVIWFSDARGVLSCLEATSDLIPCNPDEGQADNISRATVAHLLGGV